MAVVITRTDRKVMCLTGRGVEHGHEVHRIDVKLICERSFGLGQIHSERSIAVLWLKGTWTVWQHCSHNVLVDDRERHSRRLRERQFPRSLSMSTGRDPFSCGVTSVNTKGDCGNSSTTGWAPIFVNPLK